MLPKAQYPSLSAYRSARAREIRQELFNDLGPRCAECGCDLTSTPWEVNHIYQREWHPRKLSNYRRQLRYVKEAREGLLNLLCKECNAVYRPKERVGAQGAGDDPF